MLSLVRTLLASLFSFLIVSPSFAQTGVIPFQMPKFPTKAATDATKLTKPTWPAFTPASQDQLRYLKSGKDALGWTVPMGVYRVRLTEGGGTVSSVKCMNFNMGGDWWWLPNLGDQVTSPGFWQAMTCGNWASKGQDTGLIPAVAIIPSTAVGTMGGRYTLRPVLWDSVNGRTITPPSGNNDGNIGIARRIRYCLTIARGVLIGPPRIDILPCAGNQDGLWEHAGAGDQVFNIFRVGPAPYRAYWVSAGSEANTIGTFKFVGSDSNGTGCIATRAPAPFVTEGEGLLWECNDEPLQKFELDYLGKVEEPTKESLSSLGFADAYDGMVYLQRIEGAIIEVNSPQGSNQDFYMMESSNDGGNACAYACLRTTSCRAYTWYRPQTMADKPQCKIISVVGQAQPSTDGVSGVLRP